MVDKKMKPSITPDDPDKAFKILMEIATDIMKPKGKSSEDKMNEKEKN